MTVENSPYDIVKAYGTASRVSALNPKMQFQEFSKVINFCEGKTSCDWDNSVKRNMLLFWAYNKIAEMKVNEGNYIEALNNWQKGCKLVRNTETRIKIGNKMLELIDKVQLNIPEKAERIIFITHYLYDAYNEIGDVDNAYKMARIKDIATNLTSTTIVKH